MVCKRATGWQAKACTHSLPPSSWECVLHFGLNFLLIGILCNLFSPCNLCTMHQPEERVYISQRNSFLWQDWTLHKKMLFLYLPTSKYVYTLFPCCILRMIKHIPFQNPDLRNIRNLCFAILFPWILGGIYVCLCNFISTWTIIHSWVSTVAILFT